MNNCRRIFFILTLSLLVVRCAQITLVDPSKPAAVGDGVSVQPQVRWNQATVNGQIVWTQNGFNLDTVHFVTGLKSGKPLYSMLGMRQDGLSVFDSKMLPNDVQDLVVSTMEKEGFDNVRTGNLAPCPFGHTTGFCFNLSFATKDGLDMKGMVIASERADMLDLFEFRAPSEYYFDALSPTVSKVFASIDAK